MGVPKFFRYISERYPCLSEFVKEYQIPSFDNLYLDMNGIIHMCSHPDDNNPHFRITEEKIFIDVFHYIEFLFRMVKPQKVFFMAVDGVAPRAKMNQQRGRRFRSAKEAEKLEDEAKKKGEKLPQAERFDSNCITPGTEFMARLHEQLKYFVVNKISTDKMWKKCKVILSGHETPGEGEHKIMDYIRYIRSQPGYDPNTRHCLYGLDADLIMLGLCTHEPHFSLLREEVKFGKKIKRSNVPEETRFYLLHLSLMREYLELEFIPLKKILDESEKFKFDIEKIIDDWILMGFLVGNDFIPNLPNLHIANGALPILYKAYMEVLPTLNGYINEEGTLNLERFEKFMKELSDIDVKNFEEIQSDMLYFESKTGRKQAYHTPVSSKSVQNDPDEIDGCTGNCNDADLAFLIKMVEEFDMPSEDESDKSSSNEDEDFKNFKDEYYRNKLEYQKITPEVLREQAEGYVRAIQWNLNYYYNGVCSWSWFYPHHYAPYISDIKGFSNLKIDFELGKPFKPYEQLLAVLPTASKNLLPKCYHNLMTDENSIIKSYYPEKFQTDLNGKRQEWEAIVLVPFIDEKILLDAMKSCNELLTVEEQQRNSHGPMLIYEYSDEDLGVYRAPNYFPSVKNQARCTPTTIEEIRVPKEKLVKGAYPGVLFDVFYPGFPTMKHLKYEGVLKKSKVKVFETPSRNENMILKLIPSVEYFADAPPIDLLGKIIWVGWPYLVEAKVVALSNRKQKYVFCDNEDQNYKVEETKFFDSELEGITKHYKERLGIDLGETKILVHVQSMVGRRYMFSPNRRINLEKQFSQVVSNYPLQSIVFDIEAYNECCSMYTDISDVFPVGSTCFSLTQPHYGAEGTIVDNNDFSKTSLLKVSLDIIEEPDLSTACKINEKLKNSYQTATNVACQLSMSNRVFSRITGSLYISTRNQDGTPKSVNIGLDLKFNKKNEEIPGYTKKIDNVWLYTNKVVDSVKDYQEKFPEVFNFLSKSDEHDMIADEVFDNEGEEKVKEIQIWLRTLPTFRAERRVCGSNVLEPEVIAEIEKVVDSMTGSQKSIVMQIKPQLLFKPEIQTGNLAPDYRATTLVFDRIINIRQGFTVPYGFKGTVVGVHKASNASKNEDDMFDVVFDKSFAGGMILNCSENRGYRLPKTAFINVSHGKRQMEKKTGAPGALRALAREQKNNGNYFNGNNVNTDGHSSARQPNSAFASFNGMLPSFMGAKLPPKNIFFPQYNSRPHSQTSKVQEQQKPKNVHNYMLDFGQPREFKVNKENCLRQKNNETVQNKQTMKTPTQLAQKSMHSKPPEINTEFLKKILNIDNNSNNKRASRQNSAIVSNLSQYNEAAPSTSDNTNKIQTPVFKSATADLLTYYQSNSFGCPRYTYFEDDAGYSAQVVLPNGTAVYGQSARTRERASENVAKEALNMLKNNPKTTTGLPSQFPTPPIKWVQRQQQNKQSPQFTGNKYFQGKYSKMSVNSTDLRKEAGFGFARNNPSAHHNSNDGTNISAQNFVPLQAMKKRQSQSSRAPGDNVIKTVPERQQITRQEKRDLTKVSSQGNTVNKGKVNDSNDKFTKLGRARKTRIAANFNK